MKKSSLEIWKIQKKALSLYWKQGNKIKQQKHSIMKKIIIAIISVLILMPTMADAQIQVNKCPKVETIKSIRLGYVTLDKTEEVYFLSMISDNQFDNSYIIVLGEGKDAATQSLNSLIEISSTITKEDSFEFNDGLYDYHIFRGPFKSEVWFKADGYAGYGKTSTAELNSLLKALTKTK